MPTTIHIQHNEITKKLKKLKKKRQTKLKIK